MGHWLTSLCIDSGQAHFDILYLTWISIRCILYPYLLVEFAHMWNSYSIQAGTRLNVLAIVLPLHAIFCLLNVKWTYDLIMSKLRYWRRKGKKEPCKGL